MIPEHNCLDCGKLLWDNKPKVQPTVGDFCVCVFCGCPMEFGKKLKLKRPIIVNDQMKEMSKIIKTMNMIGLNSADIFKKLNEIDRMRQ